MSVDPRQAGMAIPEGFAVTGRRPWLSACAGWFAAGALASLGAWAVGFEPSRVVLLGALAGGVAGPAVVGWVLGVLDTRRRASASPSNRADLWDPWVDEGGTGRRDQDSGPAAIIPARALVRPRVLSPEGGSFLVEDEVYPFAKGGERGAIRIDGPIGSGKSTALRHLLASLPPELDVRVFDGPGPLDLADHAGSCVVVYASDASASPKHLATFFLAPWGEDEVIEYLLAVSSTRCASVMARLKAADDESLARGNPELWRVVLDRMIADESTSGVREALRGDLAARLRDGTLRERVGAHCLSKLGVPVSTPPDVGEQDRWRASDPTLHRLIRHYPVGLLLAADRIVDDLAKADAPCPSVHGMFHSELIREAGRLLHGRPEITGRLASMVDGDDTRPHSAAASLLHAAKVGWRPTPGRAPKLSYALLEGVDWPGVVLSRAEMDGVEMGGACLWKATLDAARLDSARLRRARLNAASLQGAKLNTVALDDADLSSSRADGAIFNGSSLVRARLESASLRSASFVAANLTDARFRKADLTGANLEKAIIDGADFSEANLESASLRSLTLSKSRFAGASFAEADLYGCNLEGMELTRAQFPGTTLHSALMTGSIMPGASFLKADLRDAGLAEVSWEGACLVGADLRGASFHMGSSRSGLVNSPIASEGTRTGFYTDDYDEQDYKPLEEIRKADLRGVDLRRANLEGVDLYLVDLRGATLDPSQAHHARSCGAILRDRRS